MLCYLEGLQMIKGIGLASMDNCHGRPWDTNKQSFVKTLDIRIALSQLKKDVDKTPEAKLYGPEGATRLGAFFTSICFFCPPPFSSSAAKSSTRNV